MLTTQVSNLRKCINARGFFWHKYFCQKAVEHDARASAEVAGRVEAGAAVLVCPEESDGAERRGQQQRRLEAAVEAVQHLGKEGQRAMVKRAMVGGAIVC